MKTNSHIVTLIVNLRLCLLELWSNKTRSFITSFGIFLGVASLLVNISFIKAMDKNLKESMQDIGGINILTIRNKKAETETEVLDFRRSSGLTFADAESLAASVPGIKSILPQVEIHGSASANGKRVRSRVNAIGPENIRVYNFTVEEGRIFTPEDHYQALPVCLIGKRVAERIFGKNGDPIGKQIQFNSIQLTVIGLIYTDDPFSWRARQILFPYSLYEKRFQTSKQTFDELAFEIDNIDNIDKTINQIHFKLLSLHRGVEDFDIEGNEAKLEEMRTASMGMRILLISIAIITLAVGGISIMNIMFATIGDRIREIGIRKALGAKPIDIFIQFAIESVMLCFVGGIPGMVLGGTVTLFPEGFFPFNPILSPMDYAIAAFFTFFAGLISGLFPSLHAAKMQPVDALRY